MKQKQSQTVIVNIGKTGKAKGKKRGKAKGKGSRLISSFMPNAGSGSYAVGGPTMGKPQSLEQSLFNNTMPPTIPLISQLGYPALTNNFQPQSSSTRDTLAYQGLLTQQPTVDVAGSKPSSSIATNILSGNANPPPEITDKKKGRGVNKVKIEVMEDEKPIPKVKPIPKLKIIKNAEGKFIRAIK